MKRRRFLSLIGAATTAPMMPAIAATAPTAPALYSRTLFSRAVMHARVCTHVSARGVAFRLKVSLAQAEAMIAEMTRKGMVRPVLGGAGHVRSISAIVKPHPWASGDVARRGRTHRATTKRADLTAQSPAQDTSMLAHLHGLCRDYGMRLSNRALQQRAAQ